MNERFLGHIDAATVHFAQLLSQPLLPVRGHGLTEQKGIYVLYEGAAPVHVGRTRKIRQRLRAHCTPNHNSASFAFKRARKELGRKASYSVTNSRAALQLDPVFGPCFQKHVAAVAEMQVRFLPLDDPIDQYLLELYAVLELGLPEDEFDTH